MKYHIVDRLSVKAVYLPHYKRPNFTNQHHSGAVARQIITYYNALANFAVLLPTTA